MTSENNQDVMATPAWMMVGQVPSHVGEVRTVTPLDRVKVSEPEKTSDAPWRKGCEAAIDAFMEATRDRALENITERQLDEKRDALDAALKKAGVEYVARIEIKNKLSDEALGLKPKKPKKPEFLKASQPVTEMADDQPEPQKVAAVKAPEPENPSIAKMRLVTLPLHGRMNLLMQRLTDFWSANNRELYVFNRYFKKNYANANEEQRADLATTFRTLLRKSGLSDEVNEAVINYRVGAALGITIKGPTPPQSPRVEWPWVRPVTEVAAPEPAPVVEEPKANHIPQAVVDTLPTPPTQKEAAQQSDLEGFRQHMRQRYTCASNTEKRVLSNALRAVMDEEGVPAKTREAAIRDLLGMRAKRGEPNDWQERTAGDDGSAKGR